jgi:arginine deiminase
VIAATEQDPRTLIRPHPGVGQPAEWLPARVVLVCAPEIETLFALLETDAANFLRPFSLSEAAAEHANFRTVLEGAGIQVIDVREALVRDPECLRSAASLSMRYALDASIDASERDHLIRSHDETIRAFDPASLADLIMLRPTVHISPNVNALDPTSRFLARFDVAPANNAYYMRDPLVTTARGVAIGRLRLDVRQPENDIMALVLEQLGIRPLLRIQEPGTLEGGDFLPAGDVAFQGMGLLSDEDGVGQMLDAGAYGDVEVAVVRDMRAQMDEMHLDTYFAIYGPKLVGICEDRFGKDEPEVDIYLPEETVHGRRYSLQKTIPMIEYLQLKGFEVLTFTKEEQDDFAANGLLIAPMHYLAASSMSDRYLRMLRDHGVRVELLPFDALEGGYGGPHCSTQVLLRTAGGV